MQTLAHREVFVARPRVTRKEINYIYIREELRGIRRLVAAGVIVSGRIERAEGSSDLYCYLGRRYYGFGVIAYAPLRSESTSTASEAWEVLSSVSDGWAGRYAAVYLFNTELWLGELDERPPLRNARPSQSPCSRPSPVLLASIDCRPPNAQWRLENGSIYERRRSSRYITQGACRRVSGALSCLCGFFVMLDWTTSHLHSELVARMPNAKEMLPSPNRSILPHSLIPFISILVTKKCGSARTARRLDMVRCNLRAFAPWGYLTPSMSWSLPTSIMGFCQTVNIAAV